MAKCIKCGEELADGARFCMLCGARQDEAVPGPAEETDAAVAAQADRVAELIESAPLAEEAAAAAENIPADSQPEAKAEPAPMTDEERSARLRQQPSLEDMAAKAPAPTPDSSPKSNPNGGAYAPAYTAPRPAEPSRPAAAAPRYAYPAYEGSARGSYEPQVPAVPKEDPEKPPVKSKWSIMSTWGTFGSMVLMGIPVIGLIFMIVWACGGCRKYAKRNLARAVLLGIVLCLILSVAGALVLRFVFPDTLVRAFEFFNPGYTIEF